jgi:hypothetical protein
MALIIQDGCSAEQEKKILLRALQRELDLMRANGVPEDDDDLNCLWDMIAENGGIFGECN